MGGKIKNLFLKIFSDKRALFFSLGLVLFLTFLPSSFVRANIFGDIVNGIKNLPVSIPTLIVAIPLFIIVSAIGLLFTLLAQAMILFAQATMSIGVTPATQSIVQIGWSVSQQLANIFFILILAFIGLGTILRLQTYQLQKTLPALIMIALLVNFSGALVGFVVDLGNLFTSFFLSQASSFQNLGQSVLNLLGNILDMVTAPGLEIVPKAGALIIQLVVQFIYFVFATAIVLIIMLMFFFRTVILWILAILAPIAFAAYVLPATKKWWSQWWQQLIQWSIMGIPISFFLFISSRLLAKMPLPGQPTPPDMGFIDSLKAGFGTTDLAMVITSLIGNFVVLIMLAVGVMLSMQMAPAGAQAIINQAKGVGMRTVGWAGREGWRNVLKGKKIEKFGANIRQYGQRMEATAAEKKGLGKLWGKSAGFGIKAWGGGVELGSKGINANLRARDRAAVEAGQKLTGVDSQKGLAFIRAEQAKPALQDTSRIMGAFTQIIKNGDADDINKAIESGDIHRDLLPKLYKNAMENGNVPEARMMAKAFLGRSLGKDNEMGVSEVEQEKILDKTTADDLKNMASENLDPTTKIGEKALDTMMLKSDSQLVPAMLKMKKKQREAIWGHIQGKGAQWFIDNGREDTLRWSASNAARGMGLGSIDNLTDAQVKTMIERKGSELSTEQLKERMGRLQDSLSQTPQGKQRNAVQAQINRLQEELDLRDEKSNPNDTLSQKKETLETRIRELENKEGKTADEYKEKASKERELRPVVRELRRRGKLEAPPAAEEEPLAVQIEKLKAEEESLKSQRKNLYGYARDNVNKDSREKSARREKLEEQFKNQPEGLRNIENSILKTRENVKSGEKDSITFDDSIKVLENEAKQIEGDLAEEKKTTNAPKRIAELEGMLSRNKANLQARQINKDATNQKLQEAREHLKGLMTDWRDFKGAKPEGVKSTLDWNREKLRNAAKEERDARQNLSQLRIQKVGPGEMAEAEKRLSGSRERRERLEVDLARRIRLEELTQTRRKTQEKLAPLNLKETPLFRDTERISDSIRLTEEAIKTAAEQLPTRNKRVKEIEKDREKILKTVMEEIAPRLQEEQLRLNPQLKTVPRDFLTRLSRTKAAEDIRYRALDSQLENAQKGLNDLKEKMRRDKNDLAEFLKRRASTRKEYNELTQERATLSETLMQIQNEAKSINEGKTIPKLSKEEMDKLK